MRRIQGQAPCRIPQQVVQLIMFRGRRSESYRHALADRSKISLGEYSEDKRKPEPKMIVSCT